MRNQLATTLALLVFTIFIGTAGYYTIYGGTQTLLDCLYMTIVTLSTVGYGEVTPVQHNTLATLFTIALMTVGIAALTYAISLMTAFMVEGHLSTLLRRRAMLKKIAALDGHYIVCGAGQTGAHVIAELVQMGYDTVVIESDEERLKHYQGGSVFTVQGDATDDEVLAEAGLDRAKGIVVVLANDKDNLFITITARQLNPRLRIVAKGLGPKIREKLQRAGANAVVSTNIIGGLRLASELIRPSVVSFLDTMLRQSERTLRIEEINIAADSKLCGMSLMSCPLKSEYGLLILAFMNQAGQVEFNPPPNAEIKAGMTIIVMGDAADIIRSRKLGVQ